MKKLAKTTIYSIAALLLALSAYISLTGKAPEQITAIAEPQGEMQYRITASIDEYEDAKLQNVGYLKEEDRKPDTAEF